MRHPVASGIVAGLAHPGGNVTGISSLEISPSMGVPLATSWAFGSGFEWESRGSGTAQQLEFGTLGGCSNAGFRGVVLT